MGPFGKTTMLKADTPPPDSEPRPLCMMTSWWLVVCPLQSRWVQMMHLELFAVVLLWLCDCKNGEKTPLRFSYITTKTGSFVASGAIPVVDLALEQINNRTDILTNYTLSYTTILDSKVILPYSAYCWWSLSFGILVIGWNQNQAINQLLFS